jgi:hypothetical protein
VEKLEPSAGAQIRTRIATGRPCRLHHEGYDAFVSLFAAYIVHARQHDDNGHVETFLECQPRSERKSQSKPADGVRAVGPLMMDPNTPVTHAAASDKKTKKKASRQ